MNAQEAKIEALDNLILHCQSMAKARNPFRRIAASELEIQLTRQRDELSGCIPMAVGFARREDDPAVTPPADSAQS